MTSSHGVVELRSDAAFEDTLDRLEDALRVRPVEVFARIDHQANAARAGLSMPPTTVIVFGAARAGTPLMLAEPLLALDLPLRILVSADPTGVVSVAYHDPTTVITHAGLPGERAGPLHAAAEIAAIAAGRHEPPPPSEEPR